MKVAINRCYGGFGLSPKAVKRLSELQGRECYFFKCDYVDSKYTYTPVDEADISDYIYWSVYDVRDPNGLDSEDSAKHSIDTRLEDRSDPLLIQVIEELGDAASGFCAELKIVEIPDGTKYEIEEYDGKEWVSEIHNTWA